MEHQPSFLSLSPSIRQRIYLEADLLLNEKIDLNGWIEPSYPPKKGHRLTYNLLLTCRIIYAEVSVLVYSMNGFFIRYGDTGSLKALSNLTGRSLASLTRLTILLNVACCDDSCSEGRHLKRTWLPPCQSHDRPLGSSKQDSAVLLDWENVASHIATHIKPFSLELDFLCDVENLEIGRLVVRPLQKNITPLAKCNIRLNSKHDPLLQALAIETATKAKGLPYPSKEDPSPFRYMDLPQELRLKILEYTDLVTPLREVEWNPQENFYFSHERSYCDGFFDCSPSQHRSCLMRSCWLRNPGRGCFCTRYHTAVSSDCRCWIPPTSLFLVCKVIREEAQTVFFALNHFVIAPTAGCHEVVESSPEHIEALVFFTKVVPPHMMHLLRSLEIVFPPFVDDYIRIGEPALLQWCQATHYMCKLNLPSLSLSVVMADVPEGYWIGEDQMRENITKEEARKIMNMYARVMFSLAKLKARGLEAFFLTVADPYEWKHFEPPLTPDRIERRSDNFQRFVRDLEQIVMGKDYDSSLLQERAHGPSGWLKRRMRGQDSVW